MTEKSTTGIKKINLLISIILAFTAWVYVIYNYAPMKEVYYKDVPIQFTGEDTLAYKGLSVSKASQATVDIKAKVKRTEYANISEESFDVVADVSSAVYGDNGISLEVTAPEDATVESISAKSVNVSVDKSSSKQVKVTAIYGDAIDTNSEPAVTAMGYRNVTVSGTSANLNKVKYAAVVFSVANVSENTQQFYCSPIALNKNGKEVAHIVVVPSEISVSVYKGYSKEVPLVLNVTNNSSDDKEYEAPETVVIKGSKKALADIEEIETEEIDITGVTEETEIPLTYILPDGVDVTKSYIAAVLKVRPGK